MRRLWSDLEWARWPLGYFATLAVIAVVGIGLSGCAICETPMACQPVQRWVP